MIRKKLFGNIYKKEFRHRGTEILRIEALSDAVFAFSVSLLVASLEAPQTFSELRNIVYGAIPFFATVAIIFLLWYQQYIFFRHYALNDTTTIVINLFYLAVILFYVYPLRFLFSLLLSSWTGIDLFPRATLLGEPVLLKEDFSELVITFSAGYFLVWILLYFMHKKALASAKKLELTPFEVHYTRKEARGALWNSLVGLFSIALAFTQIAWLPGVCYLFIPLLLFLNEKYFKIKLKKIKHFEIR